MPYFRKLETDTDFSDDFHGTDGPIIARALQAGRVAAGATGVLRCCKGSRLPGKPRPETIPIRVASAQHRFNNPQGIRWSTNIGYLGMSRHRLNLTIRANCATQRILFEGRRAVGVQVESGGENLRGVRRTR